MSTRVYPLFHKGNPQLRIFLPNFWMKIVKPKEPLPPYMVLFQTSIEMTDYDVKNYLEKIYKLPIVEVKTTIKQGLLRKAYDENYIVKEDDFKEAMVTFPRTFKFTYPELIDKDSESSMIEETKKMLRPMTEKMRTTGGLKVPLWFT